MQKKNSELYLSNTGSHYFRGDFFFKIFDDDVCHLFGTHLTNPPLFPYPITPPFDLHYVFFFDYSRGENTISSPPQNPQYKPNENTQRPRIFFLSQLPLILPQKKKFSSKVQTSETGTKHSAGIKKKGGFSLINPFSPATHSVFPHLPRTIRTWFVCLLCHCEQSPPSLHYSKPLNEFGLWKRPTAFPGRSVSVVHLAGFAPF